MRYKLLMAMWLFGTTCTFSQVEPLQFNLVSPSPNASSLGKYADTPVSYYSGTPSIQIPLYTLGGKTLSVPVSLSYQSGGIRVEEVASNVGLGWTLNAGGAIIRTLRGQPDEDASKGILNHGITPDMVLNASPTQQADYFIRNNNGNLDFEPDLFSYNFNGKSGKFFLEKIGTQYVGYSIPFAEIKIVLENNLWTITDSEGTKYFFGGADASEITLSVSSSSSGRSSVNHSNYKSAWFLKKIVSITGEEIIFDYEPYEIELCQRLIETKYVLREGSDPDVTCFPITDNHNYNETTTTGLRLTSITSELGKINFVAAESDRLDLPGDKAIKEIKILDHNGNLVKKFTLEHDYFISSGGASFSFCNDPSRFKRLKLNSVQELANTGEEIPPYKFKYNSSNLPDKFSNAQDHWGFFNGANNGTLIPPFSYTIGGTLVKLPGADRKSNENKMKAGVLEKITYPTGGSTAFEFEANTAILDDDFFPYEEAYEIPRVQYAHLRARDGRSQSFEFDVNLPELEPGLPGGLFTIGVSYGGPCNPSERTGCGGVAYLIDVSNEAGLYSSDGGTEVVTSQSDDVFLKNGRYRLELEVYDPNASGSVVGVSVGGPDPDFVIPINNRQIGGLRIKSIKDYDETEKLIGTKQFTYLLEGDPAKSSGKIVSKPVYNYQYVNTQVETVPGMSYTFECLHTVRSASSNAPLSFTQGSSVGYRFVQVYQTDHTQDIGSANGKELYFFTTAEDYPDVTNYSFPFTPHTSKDWMRGLLKEFTMFKRENENFIAIKKSTSNYGPETTNYYREAYGLKMGCETSGTTGCSTVKFKKYSIVSFWNKLDYSTDFDFKDSKAFSSQKNIYYDQAGTHTFPTRTETTDSEGKIQKSITKYPLDYQTGAFGNLQYLKDNHIISKAIEQQQWLDGKLIAGQIIDYQVMGNKLFVKRNLLLEIDKPLNLIETKSGNLYTDFIPSNRYKEANVITTNPITTNITDILPSNTEINTAYLWGYGDRQLIAKADNAHSNQIYFENFEDTGISGDARSGRKFHSGGSFTIPFVAPSDGRTYNMSYWFWSGDKWNFSGVVAYNANISNGEKLDDIRVFPSDCLMTTYTYDPLVGITSITDSNNLSTFYEYDPFSRLLLVRDSKKKIIKTFRYNYFRAN